MMPLDPRTQEKLVALICLIFGLALVMIAWRLP